MSALIDSLGAWGVPTVIVGILIALFIFMQVTGEIIEWCGKTAPAWLKVRKIFTKRKERIQKLEDALLKSNEALERSNDLLAEMNKHYNPEAIAQRNQWMTCVNNDLVWMHDRADAYDASIDKIVAALDGNTKMTEDMFVEDSRDRIIGFAEKVADPHCIVSHEQFRRIFRVYDEYEAFLEERNRTNGEVDESIQTIRKAYSYRQEHRCFAEDIGRYIK
jgi:hypothetical protein